MRSDKDKNMVFLTIYEKLQELLENFLFILAEAFLWKLGGQCFTSDVLQCAKDSSRKTESSTCANEET